MSAVCFRLPGNSESSQEELAGLINSIMALTNVAFFGLAGASLKLVREVQNM